MNNSVVRESGRGGVQGGSEATMGAEISGLLPEIQSSIEDGQPDQIESASIQKIRVCEMSVYGSGTTAFLGGSEATMGAEVLGSLPGFKSKTTEGPPDQIGGPAGVEVVSQRLADELLSDEVEGANHQPVSIGLVASVSERRCFMDKSGSEKSLENLDLYEFNPVIKRTTVWRGDIARMADDAASVDCSEADIGTQHVPTGSVLKQDIENLGMQVVGEVVSSADRSRYEAWRRRKKRGRPGHRRRSHCGARRQVCLESSSAEE